MRFVIFAHSVTSDWNNGNAHFLRGVATELIARGHSVIVYEPEASWSRENLLRDHGIEAQQEFHQRYPQIRVAFYDPTSLELKSILSEAEVVIVHEWNTHELVARIGAHRETRGRYKLFFHDTHHRTMTDAASMSAYDLQGYDGVLAFGQVISNAYLERKWVRAAWTWHEAADVRIFQPRKSMNLEGDLLWIGNWGDDERAEELCEFLIRPVKRLGLKAKVYGVRYPQAALRAMDEAGIGYGGWLPNYRAPDEYAKYRVTVHVPRKPYARALPCIPTIRPFEALACGIPMVSAPWDDCEGLFRTNTDFMMVRNGNEMTFQLQRLLQDSKAASEMAANGLQTVQGRHTCAHRVDQLLEICEQVPCR